MKKYFILDFLIILFASFGLTVLVAILLNAFLLQQPLKYANIIGGSKIWLEFCGSFFGSIIVAIWGFYSLIHSEEENAKMIVISTKEKELEQLKNTLVKCATTYDMSVLCNCVLYLSNESTRKSYLRDLDKVYKELTVQANAFGLIFANSENFENPHRSDFIKAFQSCHKEFISKLTDLEVCINKINDGGDSKEQDEVIKKMCDIVSSNEVFKSKYAQPLFNAARDWIEYRQKEICELKKDGFSLNQKKICKLKMSQKLGVMV